MTVASTRLGSNGLSDSERVGLRARIDERCAEAHVLLVRARHDDMKAHVRFALRELTEATRLVNEKTSMSSGLLLQVLDATISSATLRLDMVEIALSLHGPEVSDL